MHLHISTLQSCEIFVTRDWLNAFPETACRFSIDLQCQDKCVCICFHGLMAFFCFVLYWLDESQNIFGYEDSVPISKNSPNEPNICLFNPLWMHSTYVIGALLECINHGNKLSRGVFPSISHQNFISSFIESGRFNIRNRKLGPCLRPSKWLHRPGIALPLKYHLSCLLRQLIRFFWPCCKLCFRRACSAYLEPSFRRWCLILWLSHMSSPARFWIQLDGFFGCLPFLPFFGG